MCSGQNGAIRVAGMMVTDTEDEDFSLPHPRRPPAQLVRIPVAPDYHLQADAAAPSCLTGPQSNYPPPVLTAKNPRSQALIQQQQNLPKKQKYA